MVLVQALPVIGQDLDDAAFAYMALCTLLEHGVDLCPQAV